MQINKLIDHTVLKATATTADIEKLCQEARFNDFKSVCVNPANVLLTSKLLEGSDVSNTFAGLTHTLLKSLKRAS